MLYLSLLDFRDDALYLKNAYEMGIQERARREKRIKKENNAPLVLLITCTRIEAYSMDRKVSFESIERAFGINHIYAMDKRKSMQDEEALKHLYRLSLGIESPLFGEELILSQMKEAYSRAVNGNGACSYLLRLFKSAVTFSKAMHSKYRIRIFDETVPSELARRIGRKRRVLIVGSGELARMTAIALRDGNEVLMTLRDISKTELVPSGVRPVMYEKRHAYAEGSDVIVSASSGIYYTFEEKDKDLLADKELYDLALPFDMPGSLSPVRLSELGVEMPKRDALLRTLDGEIARAIDGFHKDIEMKMEAMNAEDFSISVLRRLNGAIEALSLDEEKRKSLENAIYDSTRKAYIEKERKARK